MIKCQECLYVIPLYFAFQTRDYLYLALQYIPSGDLCRVSLTQLSRSKPKEGSTTRRPSSSSLS